jgi:hypothetical protein
VHHNFIGLLNFGALLQIVKLLDAWEAPQDIVTKKAEPTLTLPSLFDN